MKSIRSNNKLHLAHNRFMAIGATVAISGAVFFGGIASAANTTTTASPKTSADQQQRIQTIITKGDQEITRRLTSLGTLSTKINVATKLSANDKSVLSNEVATTTTGLTSLKGQLDADTTVATAHTDAESIYSEYRVYAVVMPKVNLIKVADTQLVVQAKLTSLAQKLQSRIANAQKAGKNVTAVQNQLTDMTAQITAAQAISTHTESSIISLQPTDYNSNHTVLNGYSAQLKTAHGDNQAAYADAKTIVTALKSL